MNFSFSSIFDKKQQPNDNGQPIKEESYPQILNLFSSQAHKNIHNSTRSALISRNICSNQILSGLTGNFWQREPKSRDEDNLADIALRIKNVVYNQGSADVNEEQPLDIATKLDITLQIQESEKAKK